MKLWQSKLNQDPVIRLIGKLGLEGAAGALEITTDQLKLTVENKRCLWDFERFSGDRLKIINKDGQLVAFTQNGPQKRLDSIIDDQRTKEKPVRICLLKARQWGGSTKFEGHIFRDSMLRVNRSSMIVAHDLESARHLREMSYRFYEHYELDKPKLRKESDKWWKFQHREGGKSADSHLRIDTADELSGGHSLTIHNLHLSELQSWRNASELVLKGLFPTVPYSSDTMIFMEGSGSGVGNWWYEFCQNCQQPDTGWAFVFVPWFEIPGYSAVFESGEAKASFEKSLDQDETYLRNQGVELEQLLWRRKTLENLGGDYDAFHQEYPATPDEAFITSGRPVFPAQVVKAKLAECKEPLKTGFLRWKIVDEKKTVVFDEDRFGYWKLWEEPHIEENLHVCGADVAEGIAVIPELGNRGGDYSAARIFRRDKRRMVATFHARVDPDVFADELAKAYYLWKSPIFPEQNAGGGGNLVISRLKDDADVELIKTPRFGPIHERSKEEYGWETMKNTKRLMIDELNENIRSGAFQDPDKDFWVECSTYVRDEVGRTNAQSRKFDDLVIATAITFQADKLMPMVFRGVPEEKKVITRDMDVEQNYETKKSQESVMENTLVEF